MAVIFDRVSFAYEDKPVLSNVSFTLPEKGCLCFFGPSGCGKTTLLRLLAGLEQPRQGKIEGLSTLSVAAVFQEDRLLPWRSAEANVRLARPGMTRRQAEDWLRAVGLEEEADTYPPQLSGGMNRRVAIARALAAEAGLLILDEPFTGLDTSRMTGIAALIRELYKDRLIVMVTHSLEEAACMDALLCPLPEQPPLSGALLENAKKLSPPS